MLARQLGRDLLLGAPQDERPQRARQRRHRLRFQSPRARRGGERARRAQHAGVQELDQRPQLAQVVLDRRARQREAMVPAQQARRLRRFGVRVLDRLRLVEDHVVRLDLAQEDGVLAQHAVGRDQQVDAREPASQGGRARGALGADVGERRAASARSAPPPAPSSRPATSAPPRSKGARLGAAAPPASPGPGSSCRGPCRRPGSRRTRTGAGTPASRGRPPGRGAALPETSRGAFAAPTPVNCAKLVARLGEQLVDRDLGLRREQRVQHPRLRPPKAEAVPLDRAHLGQRRILRSATPRATCRSCRHRGGPWSRLAAAPAAARAASRTRRRSRPPRADRTSRRRS